MKKHNCYNCINEKICDAFFRTRYDMLHIKEPEAFKEEACTMWIPNYRDLNLSDRIRLKIVSRRMRRSTELRRL